MKLQKTENNSSDIKVVGIGGGGTNAVTRMYLQTIKGVDFIVCNTDYQALVNCPVPFKIRLGMKLIDGRGAGNKPSIGHDAAVQSIESIKKELLLNTKMLIITAGMGGGTGTGATPVIASLAKELNILTLAVVTLPFPSEGEKRYKQALEGIEKIAENVDSMLVISNQLLQNIYGDLSTIETFSKLDETIAALIKGVVEIVTIHGYVNINFTDFKIFFKDSESFTIGIGIASIERKALSALQQALESPLFDNRYLEKSKSVLLNIISGNDELGIDEIGEIIEYTQNVFGEDAEIIWGSGIDKLIGNNISITIIAIGFKSKMKR